ncbi:hypothetical protein WR25_07416 [Diploscapter pachys]|uniref:Uncharacterized protein n=1 Tax=Diploscapter pachys TaxID=2018661 RepID=A0A2A2KR24_9BILA|nr:hypothetical protein WR25_07416 [Diploscapter pachys]
MFQSAPMKTMKECNVVESNKLGILAKSNAIVNISRESLTDRCIDESEEERRKARKKDRLETPLKFSNWESVERFLSQDCPIRTIRDSRLDRNNTALKYIYVEIRCTSRHVTGYPYFTRFVQSNDKNVS